MSDVELRIKTIVDKAIADINKVSGSVNNLDKSAKGAGGSTDTFASSAGHLFGVLAASYIVKEAAEALRKFGEESLAVASRAQELTSKFNIVFGKGAPEARKQLDDFGKTVNRSSLDLQEMAADVQNVLVAMGVGRDEAAQYSTQMVELGIDVAAFNNVEDAQVVDNFTSAIVGNTIAAKKYGVILSEQAINQELFKNGIMGGAQAATDAEKAIARMQVIINATKDSQGQALREAESYTNVTKGLDAAMTELKEVIGDQLLPVMTNLKKETIEVVNATIDYVVQVENLNKAIDYGLILADWYHSAFSMIAFVQAESTEELARMVKEYEEANNIIQDASGSAVVGAANFMDLAVGIQASADAAIALKSAQDAWSTSTANDVSNALRNVIDEDSPDYIDALRTMDSILGTSEEAEKNHSDAVDDLAQAYKDSGGDIDVFVQGLIALRDTEMPQATTEIYEAVGALDDLSSAYDTAYQKSLTPIHFTITADNPFGGGFGGSGYGGGQTTYNPQVPRGATVVDGP